jgi:hypothetical protein
MGSLGCSARTAKIASASVEKTVAATRQKMGRSPSVVRSHRWDKLSNAWMQQPGAGI